MLFKTTLTQQPLDLLDLVLKEGETVVKLRNPDINMEMRVYSIRTKEGNNLLKLENYQLSDGSWSCRAKVHPDAFLGGRKAELGETRQSGSAKFGYWVPAVSTCWLCRL